MTISRSKSAGAQGAANDNRCPVLLKTGTDSQQGRTALAKLCKRRGIKWDGRDVVYLSMPGARSASDTRVAETLENYPGLTFEAVNVDADDESNRFPLAPQALLDALEKAYSNPDAEDIINDARDGDDDETPEYKIDLKPFEPKDPATFPMRDWIYKPYYIRKFAGSTVATGGAGKSSLILVECIAMATGKNLLGVEVEKPLRVFYWNGEDPQEEIERRAMAVLKHYGLTKADLGDRLFLKSGRDLPIKIAIQKDGNTKIANPVVKEMVRAIRDNKIDVTAIDPFVSSHGVPENDNGAIDVVAKKWSDIADKTNSHVHISHHTRKTNGADATAQDSRGASSLNNAMRTRRALNTMNAEEAKKAGIVGNERLSYFKADTAGSSMTTPTDGYDWYRFVSVDLGNGKINPATGLRGEGDSVGVVVAWAFEAKPVEEASDDETVKAIAAIAASKVPLRKSTTAADWIGYVVLKALGLPSDNKDAKKRIEALITKWVEAKKLEEYEGLDQTRHPKTFIRTNQFDFG